MLINVLAVRKSCSFITLLSYKTCIFISGVLTLIDEGMHNGSCSTMSTLAFMCTKCGEKSKMKTSKLVGSGPGKSYDVNRRDAFAMSELGKGKL